MEYLRIFFSGFAMGAADIVPGVSGGTMAFILGIYETLIDAIKSFNIDAIKLALSFKVGALADHTSLRFLIALGLGIAVAILSMASLLENLLITQRTFVFAFFAGLIIASVLAIGIKVKWTASALIALVIGGVVAYFIVGLPALDNAGHSPLVLFLSGVVAICAMILPGISGSFILLILGQYDYILGAVKNLDIVSVASVGVGAVVGILAFSRVLSWLLRHYENVTIAVLVGFMAGSLRKIWMESACGINLAAGCEEDIRPLAQFGTPELVTVIALVVVGFLLVSLLDHMQTGENPVFRAFWRPSVKPAAAD